MSTVVGFQSVRNYPFPSTIEIRFDREMNNNAALIDIATYTLNQGAFVTDVTLIDLETVRLTTENLFGYSQFILTVQPGLLGSSDGYDFDTVNNTAVVTLSGSADEQTNALSAANGRLKSGQQAKRVFSDANFFYIMTESGFDIVSRNSLFNKGFVLQESGFNTFFVSGD